MGEALVRRKLLVVEGKDEINFLSAMLQELDINDVEVRSFEGITNLRGYLKALRSGEGFANLESLGIVRDAETDAVAARTYIASRPRPDVSLGVAAKRGYFPLAHPAFAPIRRLISFL